MFWHFHDIMECIETLECTTASGNLKDHFGIFWLQLLNVGTVRQWWQDAEKPESLRRRRIWDAPRMSKDQQIWYGLPIWSGCWLDSIGCGQLNSQGAERAGDSRVCWIRWIFGVSKKWWLFKLKPTTIILCVQDLTFSIFGWFPSLWPALDLHQLFDTRHVNPHPFLSCLRNLVVLHKIPNSSKLTIWAPVQLPQIVSRNNWNPLRVKSCAQRVCISSLCYITIIIKGNFSFDYQRKTFCWGFDLWEHQFDWASCCSYQARPWRIFTI